VNAVTSTKSFVKCGTALWPLLIQSKGTVYKLLTTWPLTAHDCSDIHVTPCLLLRWSQRWPPHYIMFLRLFCVPCRYICKE